MPGNITLGASLMVAEITSKISGILERIDLSHPGLSEHQSTKLAILVALLEDVEHQTREMARALLSASAVPNVEESEVIGPLPI